jgi:tetratricopeptide (TPR) repeat protein
LAVLRDMLGKQLALAATRGLPDRAMHNFHIKMGGLQFINGNAAEALKHYQEAGAITARLMASEEREKDKAKANHALVLQLIGNLYRDAGKNVPEALKRYKQAEKLQREIVTAPTTGEIPPAEAKQSLAGTLYETAEAFRQASRPDDALPLCEEGVKLRDQVVALPPTPYTREAKRRLADALILLGKLQQGRGKDDLAEKAFARAADAYADLVAKQPTDLDLRMEAAKAAREYGDFLLMRGRLAEATPLHERDVAWTRSVLAVPEVLLVQMSLGDAYYRSATLALKKGNKAVAADLYRRCLDLRQTVSEAVPQNTGMKRRLAIALARCGEHVKAAAAAEAYLRESDRRVLNPWYDAAGVFAVCSAAVAAGKSDAQLTPADRELRTRYTDRAIALLEDLITNLGYSDVVALKTDPDLEPLFDNDRFKAIVKRAEANNQKKAKGKGP